MKLYLFPLLLAVTLSACGGGTAAGDSKSTSSPASNSPDVPPKTSSASSVVSSKSVASSAPSSLSSSVSSSKTPSSASSLSSSLSSSSSSSVLSSSSSKSSSPSSVAKTSSSSSSAASSACSHVEGNVFIDCVDPAWKPISAYEQKKDYSVQGDVTDGTQGQLATWQITPSSDAGHSNVIDVQYKDNSNYNAFIDIYTNSAAADMSAYATGKLVFDVKLTAAGSFSSTLEVLLDCGYPCTSHEHRLTPALNQWTTIEIPISEFVDSGLNLSHVITGFAISPEWNKQNGVQFQLDNIHWVKGSAPLPVAVANCYEQRFETWNLGFHTEIFRGPSSLTSGAVTQIIARSDLNPSWSAGTDMFGYVPHADSKFAPCAFTNGLLSAQVKLAKPYVTDGRMRVGLYYEDSLNHRAYFPATTAANFTADIWKTISVPLVDANNAPLFNAADPEFNQNDIVNVGFYTDANGKAASAGGLIQLDNIFISGKPVTLNVPNSSSSSSATSSSKSSSSSRSSQASSTPCAQSAQSVNDSSPLGIGIASGQVIYVNVKLNNATFTGTSPDLSAPNMQVIPVFNATNKAIFSVQVNASSPQNTALQFSYSYLVTNAGSATNVSYTVYDSASGAVNEAPGSTLSSNSRNLDSDSCH